MANDKVHVLLLERIANIGKQNEIVEVSRTQAKNYLIPKGLAKLATPELIKQEEEKKRKAQDNKSLLVGERHKIAEQLHNQTIVFELAGSTEKVFGGVGEHEIIERITKAYNVTLEKKHIILLEGHHLKKVGVHDIKINLGSDVHIRMKVELKVK